MSNGIAILVHGGAWDIPMTLQKAHLQGVREALRAGESILKQGGTAIDATVAAVASMENDPVFDAGRGSHLNRDGVCELDALLMDGTTLEAGAVAAVRRILNPIQAAKIVLRSSPHILLVAEGAERFYVEKGGTLIDNNDLVVERERLLHDQVAAKTGSTVGAVAMDEAGDVACATSTGGTSNKLPGRVGDSPLPGCGGYADGEVAAVSTTGNGEAIVRTVLAKAVTDLIARGASPDEACQEGLSIMARRTEGLGGCIAVSRDGILGFAHTTPLMPVAGFSRLNGEKPARFSRLST